LQSARWQHAEAQSCYSKTCALGSRILTRYSVVVPQSMCDYCCAYFLRHNSDSDTQQRYSISCLAQAAYIHYSHCGCSMLQFKQGVFQQPPHFSYLCLRGLRFLCRMNRSLFISRLTFWVLFLYVHTERSHTRSCYYTLRTRCCATASTSLRAHMQLQRRRHDMVLLQQQYHAHTPP
jgi:hypothetical protein